MGAAFEAMELEELSSVLGKRPGSVDDGRQMLTQKIIDRSIDEETVINLLYARVTRENEIMRAAMGALADRHYSPLE
jgi:hypothetical protein